MGQQAVLCQAHGLKCGTTSPDHRAHSTRHELFERSAGGWPLQWMDAHHPSHDCFREGSGAELGDNCGVGKMASVGCDGFVGPRDDLTIMLHFTSSSSRSLLLQFSHTSHSHAPSPRLLQVGRPSSAVCRPVTCTRPHRHRRLDCLGVDRCRIGHARWNSPLRTHRRCCRARPRCCRCYSLPPPQTR